MVGILNSTVVEQWGGFIDAGFLLLCADGLRVVKQKESTGAITVPDRTQDNSEPNGVLNGKSSVFSHRCNVAAAPVLLRFSFSNHFSLAFFNCVFCPKDLKSHMLLFLQFAATLNFLRFCNSVITLFCRQPHHRA